jgi:4-amino-4-deoxy-L-arabinose transferase-like glycosyltransferase
MTRLSSHRLFIFGLLILWALFFLGHNWESGLKMDAMIEATNAKNAAQKGEWTLFHFAPNYYPNQFFDHPPLMAWMEGLAFKFFGVSDSVARLVPAFFGLVTLIGVVTWGALAGSLEQGLMAGFILLTSNRYIKFGSDVLLEGPLCAFLVWGAVFFLKSPKEVGSRSFFYALLTGIAFALAFMTKSVFALFLPATIGLLYFCEEFNLKFSLFFLTGIVLSFVVLIGAWILFADGGLFLKNHLAFLSGRVGGSQEHHWLGPLANLAGTYWPWLPFLGWGLWQCLKKGRKRNLPLSLAAIQVVTIFTVLSLSGHFLEHYLILILPAAAVVSSVGLTKWVSPIWNRWEKGVLTLGVSIALILAIFPVRLRRDRTEPLGTTLKEMEAVCRGQTTVLVTESAMERWMAVSIVSWLTPYEVLSISTDNLPAQKGRLMITGISENPSSDQWERVPLVFSKLKLFQPRQYPHCHRNL